MGVIVHAVDFHDGLKAHLLVANCMEYLNRMKKILDDDAYKKGVAQWEESEIADLKVEFASKPPPERAFVGFNFFRKHPKDHKKTTKSANF